MTRYLDQLPSPLDSDPRYVGPDCGINACGREVGHIGDHHPDPLTVEEVPETLRAFRSVIEYNRDKAYEEGLRRRYLHFTAGAVAGLLLGMLLGLIGSGLFRPATMPEPSNGATGAASDPGVAQRQSTALPMVTAEVPGSNPGSGVNGAAPIASLEPVTEPAATFSGRATWYCSAASACTAGYGPADLVAAVDPSLGIARGTLLRVHHEGQSVDVTAVDVCACAGTRIIDLSSGAFVQLAPLAVGVIDVAVEELAGATIPPTDR